MVQDTQLKHFKQVNVTKKAIAEKINDRVGISTNNILEIINDIVFTISDNLHKGESVKIKDFGSFKVYNRKNKVGINMKTRQRCDIPESKKIAFTTAKKLKHQINDKL